MKLALQLAYRNLVGAGLRTWLNVGVLTFAFLMIIFLNGILDGWNHQAKTDTIAWEYGNGHLLNEKYDPYDPFSIQDGHGILSEENKENLSPILLQQGSIYPEGRMVSILLKGIEVNQKTLKIPTTNFKENASAIPAIIGVNMATSTNLKIGDQVLLRWRDKNGMFDAKNIIIVDVFKTNVPTVDHGQVWIPITHLWEMTGLENHATYFVANEKFKPKAIKQWNYVSQKELLHDLDEIISMKKSSSSILYLLLLAIALLAVFDTQVLSIFRRQKEIGTYVALGMTRSQVVGLFTIEGTMYSLFATVIGCIIGVPLFWYLSKTGMAFPTSSQDMGIAMADRIYPVYGISLILGTVALVVISATIVSFLPARKIAKLNPVEALKGKIQ